MSQPERVEVLILGSGEGGKKRKFAPGFELREVRRRDRRSRGHCRGNSGDDDVFEVQSHSFDGA